MTPTPRAAQPPSPLRAAINAQSRLFNHVGWLSAVIGLLALVPSWYMFEVYGRVLNSRSVKTLAMLLLCVVVIYILTEVLDTLRGRLLLAAADDFERRLRVRVFDATFEANLRRPGLHAQAFSDLRMVREFIYAPAVRAVLDAPVAVLCLLLLFALSPWLGAMALVGALIQTGLAVATERKTMPLLTEAMQYSLKAQTYLRSTLRNAQVIESMGMLPAVHRRWAQTQQRFLSRQAVASDHAGLNASAARLTQQMQGSLLLGAAALLMLDGSLWGGGGMLIVASILGGRVLAPLTQLVAQWRAVVSVRDAYRRLDELLSAHVTPPPAMPLPAPRGVLSVEGLIATAPGGTNPILKGVSLHAQPGEVVGVIGPSASGKTTLARLLVGVWTPTRGKVRLDGADIAAWNKIELGPHIGYLPQSVELFDATVAENIARFGAVDMDEVRTAAARAGATDFIESLPQGYDTRIGEEGAVLSGGQRQRLGLARALYGSPRYLVLDEPSASLDEAGEKGLVELMRALKSDGCTVVLITHRTALLPSVDKLLVLADGAAKAFGPRDEVFAMLKQGAEKLKQMRAAQGRAPALRGPGAQTSLSV